MKTVFADTFYYLAMLSRAWTPPGNARLPSLLNFQYES